MYAVGAFSLLSGWALRGQLPKPDCRPDRVRADLQRLSGRFPSMRECAGVTRSTILSPDRDPSTEISLGVCAHTATRRWILRTTPMR
jgi:hypothetical protein